MVVFFECLFVFLLSSIKWKSDLREDPYLLFPLCISGVEFNEMHFHLKMKNRRLMVMSHYCSSCARLCPSPPPRVGLRGLPSGTEDVARRQTGRPYVRLAQKHRDLPSGQ